ncbi:sulfatase [Aeoliella sp.]|uniref:sulfatase n=1 Tax=Aeoliella sp. TaxID=2795800 RepID=UPI003CCBD564
MFFQCMHLILRILATTVLLAFGDASHAADAKPNVLFLICDDLNCDLGCYGHRLVQSPNIDRLASRGVRFDRAYCQFPLCGPSRASFMTGLYPDQTLVRGNRIRIREHLPDVVAMPQLFRRSGYFATRIGKVYHYNVPTHIGTAGHDDPDSWDYTINPRGCDVDEGLTSALVRPQELGGKVSWIVSQGSAEEQTDGIAATEAIEQIKRYAKSKRPFFLAVGLFRPHTPYAAPESYFDKYDVEEIEVPEVPQGYLKTLPRGARRSVSFTPKNLPPTSVAREAIRAYYASVSLADTQVGRILTALKSNGLEENTIVVFTSDHGYHLGEHGHYKKSTLFENAARVPLIIAGPGISPTATAAPAEMVDLYPTLAELCGLDPPDFLSGVSLLAAIDDPHARPRQACLTQKGNAYSIRTARYRYTEWGGDPANAELYDHQTDPEEMINLANRDDHTETVAKLSDLLQERIDLARTPPVGIKQVP